MLRWIYLREIKDAPHFYFPFVDASYHDYWARALVSGDWANLPDDASGLNPGIESHPYVRPPGYPFFLAFLYLISGSSHLAVRFVQMLLGLLNGVLVYFLGRRLFNGGVGLISAAFMNVYWILIYFEGKLQAPVLLIFLILCLMHLCRLLVLRTTFMRAVAVGVVLGLIALVRPNILLFLPVLLGWMGWLAYRSKAKGRFPIFAAGIILGAAAAIAPVTIRNHTASGEFVLISANAGVNLYIGNNEAAAGTFVHGIPDLETFRNCFDYPTIVRNLESKLGKELTYSQVSQYFTSRALEFISGHPLRFLELLGRKTLLFWGPGEIKHNNEVELDRRFSSTLRRIPGNFAALLAMALVGGIMLFLHLRGRHVDPEEPAERREEKLAMSVLMGLFVLTYFASFLPFFVTSLYRVPIIPFLLIAGAFLIWYIWRLVRTRAFVSSLGWLGFVSVVPWLACSSGGSVCRYELFRQRRRG
ncbi:MAG: glycosyltransferase family 39 protein [Planctomycetota bacterium]